ncbi:DUF881 domain-containing protein [Mycolicibacter terrae]|uniref:Membrane associated protein n=2 Tax=Mycolicibacter TaxID=1073531 RepID=A0A1A2XT01_MYCSD|nr:MULTISPECIES: DUF881 domain-containing protein [Mycolicibacter]OBH21471.1 hypothetical protein A5694_13100 [Mycolicibacter sinensis]OBI28217.1 hypothetical protein A5710_04275 [Mycolicibacter sinensis]RRR48090.1 DUF881 domain-containing protein [Mycolicibacter terrae]
MSEPFFALSGYEGRGSWGAHEAGRPQRFAVPSLLRSLLSEHLDPGYAAAAAERDRGGQGTARRQRIAGWAWEAVAALLVATVFAVAFAQAKSLAPGVRDAQQVLAANVRSAEAVTGRLADKRDTLTNGVDELRRHRLADDAEGQRVLAGLDALSLAAASTRVTGPGLTVTVTDPGAGRNLSDASKQRVSGSQQIILDRDLQLVVNSLWASGAEAIAIGDVRIGPNVTIRQAGGAILVDNKPISSPYSVRAIGPPRELRDAFDRTPGLYRLRLLEVSYGVVVRVDGRSGADLTLPAGSVRDVRFAKQMGES